MILNKDCYERGCAAYDDRVDEGVVVKKEWIGLTMEELDALVEEHSGWPVEMVGHVLICAAEDKLKEKNT